MEAWFQECQSCHYVSVDLSRESDNAKSIVDSEEYQALIADSALSKIARRFVFCSMLNGQNREITGTALLRAAWVCDDDGDQEQATEFRNRSAETLRQLQPFEDSEEQATTATMLIDVLRRAGRFEEAGKLANQLLKFKAVKRSEVMLAVVKFQIGLCESNSSECRKIEDAVKAEES